MFLLAPVAFCISHFAARIPWPSDPLLPRLEFTTTNFLPLPLPLLPTPLCTLRPLDALYTRNALINQFALRACTHTHAHRKRETEQARDKRVSLQQHICTALWRALLFLPCTFLCLHPDPDPDSDSVSLGLNVATSASACSPLSFLRVANHSIRASSLALYFCLGTGTSWS
ncbi:hypothetical protein F4779DRAFT_483094 [Xylariaceae sp. FL0662B]|nr:hypothetical protein F4779DRAFT_483094 [Xylariaceae sp. FL0662B]